MWAYWALVVLKVEHVHRNVNLTGMVTCMLHNGNSLRLIEKYVGKRVMVMDVERRRRKGRPKRSWMDGVNVDLGEKGLSGRRHNTGLCEGNSSEISTIRRSWKMCDGRRHRSTATSHLFCPFLLRLSQFHLQLQFAARTVTNVLNLGPVSTIKVSRCHRA